MVALAGCQLFKPKKSCTVAEFTLEYMIQISLNHGATKSYISSVLRVLRQQTQKTHFKMYSYGLLMTSSIKLVGITQNLADKCSFANYIFAVCS